MVLLYSVDCNPLFYLILISSIYSIIYLPTIIHSTITIIIHYVIIPLPITTTTTIIPLSLSPPTLIIDPLIDPTI